MWFPLRALLVAALAGMSAACGDSSSGSNPVPLTLQIVGKLAHDSVVHVRVVVGDVAVPPSDVTLTATPADAAQLLGGDSLRLLKSGSLTLSATAGKLSGSQIFEVAAPHPLSIEASGRLERGSVIRLSLLRDGAALPSGATTLAFVPAEGVQALGGDSVKLLRAGIITLQATAGQSRGSYSITVAAPPSIVFDRVVGSNRDLWRVDLDGTNLLQLTTEAADDSEPSVEAGQIVFVSLRADRNAELWSMPVAGGPATRLTRIPTSEAMPALSRDGKRLAYTNDAGGLQKLWISSSDGTGAARGTTQGGATVEGAPSWMSDGSRLAFSSTVNGNADLFTLVPGASPTLLVGGSAVDLEPAFSPDGQWVVFASTRAGGDAAHLYLLRLADDTITRLTTGNAAVGQPAWTADGRVVFTEFGATGGQLRWVDPAAPASVHPIDTGAGSARNPAPIR